jgi:hypothetical protein
VQKSGEMVDLTQPVPTAVAEETATEAARRRA